MLADSQIQGSSNLTSSRKLCSSILSKPKPFVQMKVVVWKYLM